MAKNIESLVEKEIQKGSTPLKLDSVMVPAEGFRDIDNRERLINILQYLLRVRGHKKLIWNDTLSANNVYMDVFLGKLIFTELRSLPGVRKSISTSTGTAESLSRIITVKP